MGVLRSTSLLLLPKYCLTAKPLRTNALRFSHTSIYMRVHTHVHLDPGSALFFPQSTFFLLNHIDDSFFSLMYYVFSVITKNSLPEDHSMSFIGFIYSTCLKYLTMIFILGGQDVYTTHA